MGSAPLNEGHTAHAEINQLESKLKAFPGVQTHKLPDATASQMWDEIDLRRPTVLHIAVHTALEKFRFQEDPGASTAYQDILPDEIAALLLDRNTATVVVLNACDSAKQSPSGKSLAEIIARKVGCTVVGTAAQLPAYVGLQFSEVFYNRLAQGTSISTAYYAGVETVSRTTQYSSLSGAIVMFSSDADVVVFPADLQARARLACESAHRQLSAVEEAIAEFTNVSFENDELAKFTSRCRTRMAIAIDEVQAVSEHWGESSPDLSSELAVSRACKDLQDSLRAADGMLQRLAGHYSVASRRLALAGLMSGQAMWSSLCARLDSLLDEA